LILKIASLFVLEVGPFFMTPMMLTGVLGFWNHRRKLCSEPTTFVSVLWSSGLIP
jgi:hypothetical protein